MAKEIQTVQQWNQAKWEDKHQDMYEQNAKNKFPWHLSTLDPDYLTIFEKYLSNIKSTILDLGACSGEQSIEMAKLGHKVVGIDISEAALKKAIEQANKTPDLDIEFLRDDILASNLAPNQFDLITDRACFHCLYELFPTSYYIQAIDRLLKNGGLFVIKAMSDKEERHKVYDRINNKDYLMPYRFKAQELIDIFSQDFTFLENWQSVIHSQNINPPAIAEVAVFKKTAY